MTNSGGQQKSMSIMTNYEKWYEGDEYHWGTAPAGFCDELISRCPPSKDKKVLDIGCGEGKDDVYMAQKAGLNTIDIYNR